MSSMTTTYLLPAILLNPAFILHCINTFVSHYAPPPTTISHSPHPFMESLGPVPGSTPYMDMHADDQLCWRYTAIMVVLQMLAFGRVSDNRVAKKSAKAAKIEKERLRQEQKEEARMQALVDVKSTSPQSREDKASNGLANGYVNGHTKITKPLSEIDAASTEIESEDSSSTTGSSEEEMIV